MTLTPNDLSGGCSGAGLKSVGSYEAKSGRTLNERVKACWPVCVAWIEALLQIQALWGRRLHGSPSCVAPFPHGGPQATVPNRAQASLNETKVRID